MNYLYHMVPDEMNENTLFPLNVLKEKYPEVYDKEFKKYIGRESVTEQKIPFLNCLWSDVIHFTAVHPSTIRESLLHAGAKNIFQRKFYEIDSRLLDSKETIVYLYKYKNISQTMSENNFAKYDSQDIQKYSQIPDATYEYYKQSFLEGKRPLLFKGVPHILYKGSLDVSKLNTI